ncbi:MAG TPA: helix-turn-helix domain containing protein [Streptomyces sp.]
MNPQVPQKAARDGAPSAEALRKEYEAGATVDELVVSSGLSYGTVLKRLHTANTQMRTSWQTRRMRRDSPERRLLAARLRVLYEKQGATLGELARKAGMSRRGARRLLIEAGGTPRTPQQTQRMRWAARAAQRQKLAMAMRERYEDGGSVPALAVEFNYSTATIYRLLSLAGTRMRPQHRHSPSHPPLDQP